MNKCKCNYSLSCRSKPVRPPFIFGAQIKIFLMKSESFLTLQTSMRIYDSTSSHSFIKLQLNHWCHMDYFNDVFTIFLGLECISCMAVYGRVRELSDFIKNILICVLKMNEGLTGLDRHEGEKLMTEFSFLGLTIPLRKTIVPPL